MIRLTGSSAFNEMDPTVFKVMDRDAFDRLAFGRLGFGRLAFLVFVGGLLNTMLIAYGFPILVLTNDLGFALDLRAGLGRDFLTGTIPNPFSAFDVAFLTV
jgi:hypothetical protein